jgi:hypothetical protein
MSLAKRSLKHFLSFNKWYHREKPPFSESLSVNQLGEVQKTRVGAEYFLSIRMRDKLYSPIFE